MHTSRCNRRAPFPGRWAFLLLAWIGVAAARAQPTTDKPFVATTMSAFWNPPDRQVAQRIELDLLITFYDPEWHVLWATASDGASWFDNGSPPLPVKSGQRVHLSGYYVPAHGLTGDRLKVTVLEPSAMPPPRSIDATFEDWQHNDSQWVSASGWVCRQQEMDPTHVQYDVLMHGRLVALTVLLGKDDPVPQLTETLVRARFLYASHHDANGHFQSVAGWASSAIDVTPLSPRGINAQFDQPITGIEALGRLAPETQVHIAGRLFAADPGHSVTLRDATGQLTVATEQPLAAQIGDMIEVVGQVSGHGLQVTLLDPVCRRPSQPNAPTAVDRAVTPLAKLRLADQVAALGSVQAARHYPVQLHGVITWSSPQASFLFLQDASGGIRLHWTPSLGVPPAVGRLVGLRGTTRESAVAPEVDVTAVDEAVPEDPPPAMELTLDQALAGTAEGQRVALHGLLRATGPAGRWMRLDVTTPTGEFTAFLPTNADLARHVGSIVKVTGVCAATADTSGLLTGVQLWVPDAQGVEVEQEPLADPFAAPRTSIRELRQFRGGRGLERVVRLSGVVTYARPGRFMYVQDGDSSLLVLRRDDRRVNAGQCVDVVGLPGRDGNRIVLREARWRETAAKVKPRLVPLGATASLAAELDGRLVQVQGHVQDAVDTELGSRVLLRGTRSRFEVRADAGVVQPQDNGALVDATGVYVVEFDEYRQPRSFYVQLRSPDDLNIVAAAPWWTAPKALLFAGAFAAFALLGIVWVVVLRRRVAQQTAQIRVQLEKQAKLDAELERATRLESLGLLAGGIAHDFNNLLTVVMANIGLAAMDETVKNAAGDLIAEAERGAQRAADLTQQLLTFARGGDPVRKSVLLPDVVREAAEFARHGSASRLTIETEGEVPPANVDRAQISRVVHNLVINASQAMPEGGVIRIRLEPAVIAAGDPNLRPGRYVKLSVADEGRGIPPEHLARIFEPYFTTKSRNSGLGLATVHSIVKKHDGHVRVSSELGVGTTFDVWLPAAEAPAVPPAPPCILKRPASGVRVLFMDDEEVIRTTARHLFAQLGHTATVVADGLEVVREYEKALHAGHRYEVVVLDLTVPGGVGGRAAMEILRRIDPAVRAIVSSGYSNDPVLANYRAYGFAAVVPKPYAVSELARAISDVVEATPAGVTP